MLCSIALLAFPGRLDACNDVSAPELTGVRAGKSAPAPKLIGVRVDKNAPAPLEAAPPVATLEIESGSTVYFLELGEGRAGVAERAPERVPLVTDLLVQRENATPLEMFLVFAPRDRIPEVLIRDHAARTAVPPRSLELPPLGGMPFDFFDCDPSSLFEDAWRDTYNGVTQVVVTESYAPLAASQYDWYPGFQAYAGLNTNQTTHLGICSADADAHYDVSVHRRVDASTWHHHVTAGIGYKVRFTFHSNTPGVYRMRLTTEDAPISELAAGAAYTPSPFEGIPD